MRIGTESDQCVCPKSEEEPVTARVTVFNFSLEGKSIHLEPRVREDPKKNQKSPSPQQLRIDLQREQGIQVPRKSAGRARKSKACQRRFSDQRKPVREVDLTRRPSAVPRIPPRTPLVMSKMSMPSEGQKFSENENSVVVNATEEASNVVKRLMGTNSVVEESTATKKVSKQVAIKGNVNAISGQALQQQSSFDNVHESNNNRALSEINNSNQVMNTSQKSVSSTTMSSKTTKRESYSTQTHVQESFSSSYEDVEDNSGVAAICSPDQIKSATNVNKTSKTAKQVKEVRQSTLQSTSSIDSDISSVDEGGKKVMKDKKTSQQSTVQTVDTQVQHTKDTEKIVAENVDYTEQTKTMSVEEFQKIRTIKEFVHVQKKLKNAEDNDTEEEEEEDYESEKIMSVDDIRKRLATNPPKEVINDNTKTEQIIKGSRIEEVRTTTKTIYPNPDNGDQLVEQETVIIERKVVPAGTTIMSNTENTEETQKKVVATQETKKTSKTETQQVKQSKTQTTETGTQQVAQQDTAVQNVQNTQNVNKQNVQAVQDVQNVQQTVQNVQAQNVQQTQQTTQNVQQIQQNTQNVQQTQLNTQNIQQNVQQNTQNLQQVQQNIQNVETQNVKQNTQNVQQVQHNIQNVETQSVKQNTQNVQQQNVNSQQTKTTDQTTTQNTDQTQTQQTQAMTLEEFQNIRKIKEYITTERKMLNPEDNFVEEEGETSFEAEIIMTLDEIRKRIASKPPKETVKDTTKDAPIPPGSKILEIRTITRTVLPNPDKNDEKVEQETVLLERTVVPAGTPLIPDAQNIPQKQVITAGQETAVKKTTSTETQQVQQTKSQVTQTGTTDTQNAAQNTNVQTQNVQNTQKLQNVQNAQNIQNVQNTQNVQTSNIQSTNVQKNVQETQNVQRNIQETQNVQNIQNTQNVQNIQNEALKTSVNEIKKTSLTSTSSIDSDTSSLDEASRLNQNNQLVDVNQTVSGSSVVKQTSSKTSKVTETRKVIKQSSTGAPETHVEEASKVHSSETVVNATCGSDGKFNVEENTKSSTTVSSGVGNEEEMRKQIQSQNKNLTKKLVSDGVTVVADVDQFKEKVVQEQEGENVLFKQTTTDSKHKRMVEDASKFEQPALALAALPSPDSQPGSASPQIEMPSFQPNK